MTPPKVFISYSHDSPQHKDRVWALSNRLRETGVDCIIDQYEESPPEGWPQWCENQVEQAQFVLVACTPTYLRRFKGEEERGKGLGVTWEGHIITQQLYNAQGKNTKFIPITFDLKDVACIPLTLQGATSYLLPDKYKGLYRHLTNQPERPMPGIGSLQPMPECEPLLPLPVPERKQDFAPIWQVSRRRNRFFTGRERVLADLRQSLEQRGIAALSGLGGMGKTQTAVEYAYRHREVYRAAFWVDADSRESLLGGFGSVAAALGLASAHAREQEVAVAEVKRWLEGNPGWLLVLDNADDLVLAREFLPGECRGHVRGHVLLTTREQATKALADCIFVRDMTPQEGALLLLRRAGVIANDAVLANAGEADRRSAMELSKELGGLPLALDQAGAFLEEASVSVAEYAGLYALEKAHLLAERGRLGEHDSVMITFSLAFEKMAAKSAGAADLLRLCAFLAPDAIPEEIFTRGGAENLGENLGAAVSNELSFRRTVGEAVRFSLLRRDAEDKTLHMHRLVQAVMQAGMQGTQRNIWAERAVRAASQAFPYVEFGNWELCQRLIPHAQACATWIQEWDFGFLAGALLLNQAGFYLSERALFAEAEPLSQRALAIRENALGPHHPAVATSLNNLAGLYDSQGKYGDAEPLSRRALAICEKALAPVHPHVATSLNNLSLFYHNQGKYEEAEPLYQRALAIRKKALAPDHPDVATSLNNLAGLYDNQGKYGEAEPLYQRALAIREQALGPDHPDVATSLNNLAGLYHNQGKYGEAEPLYQRALAIFEKALGPDHPDVAQSLNNLALLYDSQGKYREAEPLSQRALAILEKALGPDHPHVATSLNNLALLYHNQGKYGEAEPLYQRALAIREKALGPDHPDVATSLNNLAGLYGSQGKYGEAEPLYQRALAIKEKAQV